MISYPKLKNGSVYRQVIDKFKGYNHNLRIGSGEFCEMENLTSDDYPVLSVRKKRGTLNQSLSASKGMYYVPGTGLFYTTREDSVLVLYLMESNHKVTKITTLSDGEKQFALMGSELIIAPDMKAVDIQSLQCWYLSKTWRVDTGTVSIQMCNAEGYVYENIIYASSPPASPNHQQLWLCNATGNIALKQYDSSHAEWVDIASTYVKISGLGDHPFQTGDGVEISGLSGGRQDVSRLCGSHVLHHVGHGDIVITGIIWEECLPHDCAESPVTIERKVPELDLIIESGNRLWGCKNDTNEIYACKLGDSKNWNCFQGLSTDSWVGNVGTPGKFTGAAAQNGYPVFYKENCKHKVWPSATGAHQITSTVCQGVQEGSAGSLAVLDGAVFYKSVNGVCIDDGGGITEIGGNLGDTPYLSADGVIYNGKYYLSMLHQGTRSLFVYDIAKRMWHREQGRDMKCFAAGNGRLYTETYGNILDLTGNTGTLEEDVSWMAVTGDLGLDIPEQKYISRLTLRLSLDPGATLEVYARYDREQTWVKLGQVYGTDLRSFSLPVRPRRCDQLRLKLQGTGMCKLYSITKTLQKGSELP